jgi:hypothetical protein
MIVIFLSRVTQLTLYAYSMLQKIVTAIPSYHSRRPSNLPSKHLHYTTSEITSVLRYPRKTKWFEEYIGGQIQEAHGKEKRAQDCDMSEFFLILTFTHSSALRTGEKRMLSCGGTESHGRGEPPNVRASILYVDGIGRDDATCKRVRQNYRKD